VGADDPPVRPTICDHDPRGDPRRVPADGPADDVREAHAPIGDRKEHTDIDKLSLDLDDQQRSRLWMERDQVDDSSLTEVVKRDLRLARPAGGLV